MADAKPPVNPQPPHQPLKPGEEAGAPPNPLQPNPTQGQPNPVPKAVNAPVGQGNTKTPNPEQIPAYPPTANNPNPTVPTQTPNPNVSRGAMHPTMDPKGEKPLDIKTHPPGPMPEKGPNPWEHGLVIKSEVADKLNDDCNKILEEFGGLEGNIPLTHPYWGMRNDARLELNKARDIADRKQFEKERDEPKDKRQGDKAGSGGELVNKPGGDKEGSALHSHQETTSSMASGAASKESTTKPNPTSTEKKG